METKRMRLPTCAAILLLTLAGCSRDGAAPSTATPSTTATSNAKPQSSSISVAAASDLKFAFAEVITAFNEKHPQIQVETTFGSSGNFFAQISSKAPFDLFFSADIGFPRKLIEQGDAIKESEFEYAIGHLGLWVRNDSPLDLNQHGIAGLNDPAVRKIAIANPRFAPYGRAAEAALKHAEIYEAVKDRLVLGDNIAQTAQFIESGAADIGIIAASVVMASPLKDQGRFWLLPTDWYPPLQQGGVILSWAKDREACEQLRSFVISEQGQAILRRYGFSPPDRPQSPKHQDTLAPLREVR